MPPFKHHGKTKKGCGIVRIIVTVLALIPASLILGAYYNGTDLVDEQDPILTASQQAAVAKLKARRAVEADFSAAAKSSSGVPLVGSAWDHALAETIKKTQVVSEGGPATMNALDKQPSAQGKRTLRDSPGATKTNTVNSIDSERAVAANTEKAEREHHSRAQHRPPLKRATSTLHGAPDVFPFEHPHGFSSKDGSPSADDDDDNKDSEFEGESGQEHWEKKRKFIGSEPINGNWLLDCPPTPPSGYPQAWPIMDIVNNWSPDNPAIPPKHYHGLCRFDYRRDLDKAMAYRAAEVPFVVYNVPAAEKVVKDWAQPGYLEKLLGDEKYRTEVSHNNHFMYFSGGRGAGSSGKKAWRPPTGIEQMSFNDFKNKALECERRNCTTEEQHFYFRVTAPRKDHVIFKELPFFKPKTSIFIKEPSGQRGIHCRFGMSAVIAENHYDGSRNVIGLFGGRRRYILTHPNQCEYMYLLPMGHPSGRHSGDACNFDPACKDAANSVDWSNPDLEKWPKFAKMQANEVILSPGDFLYLPTHWFHYIISLGLNYQCNTRSGRNDQYVKDISRCGFK